MLEHIADFTAWPIFTGHHAWQHRLNMAAATDRNISEISGFKIDGSVQLLRNKKTFIPSHYA